MTAYTPALPLDGPQQRELIKKSFILTVFSYNDCTALSIFSFIPSENQFVPETIHLDSIKGLLGIQETNIPRYVDFLCNLRLFITEYNEYICSRQDLSRRKPFCSSTTTLFCSIHSVKREFIISAYTLQGTDIKQMPL